jgi:hypothetical protein
MAASALGNRMMNSFVAILLTFGQKSVCSESASHHDKFQLWNMNRRFMFSSLDLDQLAKREPVWSWVMVSGALPDHPSGRLIFERSSSHAPRVARAGFTHLRIAEQPSASARSKQELRRFIGEMPQRHAEHGLHLS